MSHSDVLSGGNLNVLLVEDNEHDLLVLKRTLKKNDLSWDLSHFVRAEEALNYLEKSEAIFDLIVVDHGLPGMNGFEFCSKLIEDKYPAPMVLLTGMGSEELAVRALKAGVSDYIVKDPDQGYLDLLTVVLPEVVRRFQDRQARIKAEEEKKRLESHMQQMQKLESLGVLAGGIAHHFNNLLAIILADAELVLMDLEEDSPFRRDLNEIINATNRAAKIASQMLSYSGKGAFGSREMSISKIIEDVQQLIEVSISSKSEVIFELDSDIPHIYGNPDQIRQTLVNLVTNASEAIGHEIGTIHIKTGSMHCTKSFWKEMILDEGLAEGEYVTLEVSDTGIGMDKETLKKIFDPFFTTHFTGRGLGLSVVLGIVRGHKGAIKVYSEPGKGSTFKVFLPAFDLEENGKESVFTE